MAIKMDVAKPVRREKQRMKYVTRRKGTPVIVGSALENGKRGVGEALKASIR